MSELQSSPTVPPAVQRAFERLLKLETGIDPALIELPENHVITTPSVSEELMSLLWLCVEDLLTIDDEKRLDSLLMAEPSGFLILKRLALQTTLADDDLDEIDTHPVTNAIPMPKAAQSHCGLIVFRTSSGLRTQRRSGAAVRPDLMQARSQGERVTLIEDEQVLSNGILQLRISEHGPTRFDVRLTLTYPPSDLRDKAFTACLFRESDNPIFDPPLLSGLFENGVCQFARVPNGRFKITLRADNRELDSLEFALQDTTDQSGSHQSEGTR